MAKKSRAQRSGGTRHSSASGKAAPAAQASGGLADALDRASSDWGAWLLVLAAASWFLAHLSPLAPIAIPAWIVTGLALGLFRPWYGLLLTIVVVPFTGAAVDPQNGEVLRVVPIYGAAVRVLLDRFVIEPSFGRVGRRGPPWWVVAAAVAAAGLYALSALTGYMAQDRDPAFLRAGLQWLAGGAIPMMAAWIAAAHLAAGRDRLLTTVVLGTTVVACILALAAWVGIPGVDLFTFVRSVEGGRLGALGYPTPTAMGLATVLPIAVFAAWRIRRWLVIPVLGLVLVTMVLTWSRGPLIAVGVGAVAAVLASGRLDRRMAVAGAAAGAAALVGLVAVRYGTNLDAIMAAISASTGSDSDRINTWAAAVTITIANPFLGGGWYALLRVGDFAGRRIANAHNVLLDAFASGGLPLGITNTIVILYSGWMVWVRRHTMAVYLIAAVVTFLVCGFWDIPQVRSYAAVMGGVVLGMAAGPLIARAADGEALAA